MNWIEINAKFDPSPGDWSTIIGILRDHGCENTVQYDRPPSIVACVQESPSASTIVAEIERDLKEAGAASVLCKPVKDEDWQELWKQHFKPRRVGRRFVISPTWEEFEAAENDLLITLDPGQAFGTGDHPTTRLCLELLETTVVPGCRIADVGCGSGVLSIGASKLGASVVYGCDIEVLSVEIARENANLNSSGAVFVAGAGIAALDSSKPDGGWDGVVSNIISATLIAIAPDVAVAISPGGWWIVSGILNPNFEDVTQAAARVGFKLQEQREEDDWIAALFRR